MLTYNTPAYMFNVYKNQPSRQTGSRNLMGPKPLPTIWGTYMKLVTKYQISAINKHGRLVIVYLLLKYLYLIYNNRSLQLWHEVWLYPRFIGPTLQRWSLLLDHSYQRPPLFLVQISDTLNCTIWNKLNGFFLPNSNWNTLKFVLFIF
jgi:hypothetical protein